ncbi:MAG: thiamine phosphate synthase [Magnetococcales bacterium]|nr:thiamine phosphate synthase [Magnetococcales bacterium]
MKPPLPKLLLITDLQTCPDLLDGVAQALAGGVKHLLLRIKNSPDRDTLGEWAEKLYRLTEREQAHLLISGDIQLALNFKNCGLHLPETAMTTAEARKVLGSKRLLGRSCHNLEGGLTAIEEGADYITLSPLFATLSHPNAKPIGLRKFASLREKIPGPVLALGGINVENTPLALKAGADGVAMIRGVLGEKSPEKAAADILRVMRQVAGELPQYPSHE